MKIEERAKVNLQYERDFLGNNLSENMVCRAYVKGATEQIDKACEWLKKQLYTDDGGSLASEWYQQLGEFIDGFRKAMEG